MNQTGKQDAEPDRDSIASEYFEQLKYTPYPVQEEALLAWFTNEQGVLVSAPTGTGKTLIAEAAVYEALRTEHVVITRRPLLPYANKSFLKSKNRPCVGDIELPMSV